MRCLANPTKRVLSAEFGRYSKRHKRLEIQEDFSSSFHFFPTLLRHAGLARPQMAGKFR
jgi:hypothetical protein